jgi:hypothetical protein
VPNFVALPENVPSHFLASITSTPFPKVVIPKHSLLPFTGSEAVPSGKTLGAVASANAHAETTPTNPHDTTKTTKKTRKRHITTPRKIDERHQPYTTQNQNQPSTHQKPITLPTTSSTPPTVSHPKKPKSSD